MPSPRQTDRATGFTFAGVFVVIAGIGWLVFGEVPLWALATAVMLALLACVAPGILMPVNLTWTWLAPKIGHLNNTVILACVFFLFVTPVALMMRLVGRDALRRSFDALSTSYWTAVHRQANSESYHDEF